MAAKKNTVTYNGTGRRKTSVARVDVYKRQLYGRSSVFV